MSPKQSCFSSSDQSAQICTMQASRSLLMQVRENLCIMMAAVRHLPTEECNPDAQACPPAPLCHRQRALSRVRISLNYLHQNKSDIQNITHIFVIVSTDRQSHHVMWAVVWVQWMSLQWKILHGCRSHIFESDNHAPSMHDNLEAKIRGLIKYLSTPPNYCVTYFVVTQMTAAMRHTSISCIRLHRRLCITTQMLAACTKADRMLRERHWCIQEMRCVLLGPRQYPMMVVSASMRGA